MESADSTQSEADAAASRPAKRRPAVSVIVPCFNGGRFLDGLMESLARQTFRDFEVVIVDDGSDDVETVRKLAGLKGGARVIRQANSGPSSARNVGITQARADIVAMLDCDDTIEPDFLAETVPVLRPAPPDVAIVVTDVWLISARTRVAPRYFNRFDLLFTNTLSVGIVLRKRCWQAVGGYDESMRDGYEDWDFSLRLADAGYRAIEVAKPLYRYHIWPDSAWLSRSSGVNMNRLHAALWRSIRGRHAGSYRPLAMFRIWWQSRDGSGHIALWKGFGAYVLALVLPDAWFSGLIVALRNRAFGTTRGGGRRFRPIRDSLNKAC
jgi:glycosyltransferase involved in cell wall biosynthesis